MTFTMELAPGTTYGELSAQLQKVVDRMAGVNMKPEHTEWIEILEGENCIGTWSVTK